MMNGPAEVLFEQINGQLDHYTKRIRNRVFSEYRDIPWTREQYQVLQPLIRRELDLLIQSILERLDNIGGVLPDGILRYNIQAKPYDLVERTDMPLPEIIEKDEVNIREGNADYATMWVDYLDQR